MHRMLAQNFIIIYSFFISAIKIETKKKPYAFSICFTNVVRKFAHE